MGDVGGSPTGRWRYREVMTTRPANKKWSDRLIDLGCDMIGYMMWFIVILMVIGFFSGARPWYPGE